MHACMHACMMYIMLMTVTGCTHYCTQDRGMHIRGTDGQRDQ